MFERLLFAKEQTADGSRLCFEVSFCKNLQMFTMGILLDRIISKLCCGMRNVCGTVLRHTVMLNAKNGLETDLGDGQEKFASATAGSSMYS